MGEPVNDPWFRRCGANPNQTNLLQNIWSIFPKNCMQMNLKLALGRPLRTPLNQPLCFHNLVICRPWHWWYCVFQAYELSTLTLMILCFLGVLVVDPDVDDTVFFRRMSCRPWRGPRWCCWSRAKRGTSTRSPRASCSRWSRARAARRSSRRVSTPRTHRQPQPPTTWTSAWTRPASRNPSCRTVYPRTSRPSR